MPEVAEKPGREHYLSDLDKAGALDDPEWLKAIRRAGADRFALTDFPHHKEEAWRYTNVGPVVKIPFRSAIAAPEHAVTPEAIAPLLYDEAAWPQLVFVDGFFSETLSRGLQECPEGLYAGSLTEAARTHPDLVQAHLDQWVEPLNAFITLNSAFLQDGAFVHVEANAVIDVPIHLLFLSTGAAGIAAHPRNLFIAGPSSESTILETYAALSDDAVYFTNAVTEIVIEDNACVERHKLVQEGAQGFHLATDMVRQGRDARFKSFVVTLSGKIVRNELRVVLDGEGAECELKGLYLNDGDRLIDNALDIEHAKPRCRSRMAYKGILEDTSNAVFTGRVVAQRGAQHTDSDQLNSNLLLSDSATIDTKPQLEIFADDVKCTHGATVGSFPEQLVFYFQSRGMDPVQARGILTHGFACEIAGAIKVAPLRARLERCIFEKYNSNKR